MGPLRCVRVRIGSGWRSRLGAIAFVIGAAALMAFPPSAQAQLQIQNDDGSSSIKFGFLVQGRAEFTDTADGGDTTKDLYFRRLRLLAGGKITDNFSFFVETDSPNIGKGTADGSKTTSDVYIQDFVLTYSTGETFKLDGGLILIPTCYNCNNSAAALLPVDYGAFSFLSSGPTTANVGRDYGLQARGYLGGGHLEYRAGVFQGKRDEASTVGFRYAGRLMYHFWEPQQGLFYSGAALGKAKHLSLGASIDAQDDYQTWAVDAMLDMPVLGGDAVTLQADFITYDGGDFLTSLPKQEALLVEVGYYFHGPKLGPFIQYLDRNYVDEGTGHDQTNTQIGLAWWIRGHNTNLKLGWTTLEQDGAPDRDQYILQAQIFMF